MVERDFDPTNENRVYTPNIYQYFTHTLIEKEYWVCI